MYVNITKLTRQGKKMMYVNITKSTRQGKKMMIEFYDEERKKVHTTHFGKRGKKTYIDHQKLQKKLYYIMTHHRDGWQFFMTPKALNYWFFWNKRTLRDSIEKYMSEFKLTKY